MKTLEQIKKDYSKSKGYEDWEDILLGDINILRHSINELLILVQKECLKNASSHFLGSSHFAVDTRSTITNENNIIK